MQRVDRHEFVASYGPTKGDLVRLADTCLTIEVEEGRSGVGDKSVFGGDVTQTRRDGGKALRLGAPDARIPCHWRADTDRSRPDGTASPRP
ncbi:MAG: hypothetical protein WAT09_05030 [Paracoccaceae bacterium]